MNYFKITNGNETHNNLKYKKGLIEDPLPWNPNTDCKPGGIYFIDKEHICEFLDYGIWLREVTIPDDAKVAYGVNKHKANKVIIGKRWDLRKVETWKYLVSIGADIHAENDHALRWAAAYGHLDIVKYLVENGADIHAQEDDDDALKEATMQGHLEIVKYLIENSADIHALDDLTLRLASEQGHLEIVKYLVENDADIHAYDDEALKWAAAYGHFDIVKYLIENGADIHAENDEALILAAMNEHTKVVNYLEKIS